MKILPKVLNLSWPSSVPITHPDYWANRREKKVWEIPITGFKNPVQVESFLRENGIKSLAGNPTTIFISEEEFEKITPWLMKYLMEA